VAGLKIDKLPVSSKLDTADHFGNRRSEPRYVLNEVLKVNVNVPPATGTLEAEVLDVTSAGVGLQMATPLHRGTIVMFSCGSQRIYGSVERCRNRGEGYRIGIRITDAVDE